MCHSFKEACCEKGLLEDDAEWSHALEEAAHWAIGAALRDMFTSMLMFCEVTDPRALWDQHYTALSDDIMHCIVASSVSRRSHQRVSAADVLNETLHDLDRILQCNSTSLSNFPSLSQADGGSILAPQPNWLIREEQEYDVDSAQAFVEAAQPQMNAK